MQINDFFPFISKNLEIRRIPEIAGFGVFTLTDIPSDIVVEVAPVVVMPQKLADFSIWSCEAEGIPKKDLQIDQYTLGWDRGVAFPMGWTGLYNHSDDPNCKFISNGDLLGIYTIKPVQAGQQLLVSYGEHWFEAKKDYVKKISF